jgi:hypothetical protein
MPQRLKSTKVKIDDALLEDIDVTADVAAEDIPEIPKVVKAAPARRGRASKTVRVKEFDIRAAHEAWKEKNGIEDEPTYY